MSCPEAVRLSSRPTCKLRREGSLSGEDRRPFDRDLLSFTADTKAHELIRITLLSATTTVIKRKHYAQSNEAFMKQKN